MVTLDGAWMRALGVSVMVRMFSRLPQPGQGYDWLTTLVNVGLQTLIVSRPTTFSGLHSSFRRSLRHTEALKPVILSVLENVSTMTIWFFRRHVITYVLKASRRAPLAR